MHGRWLPLNMMTLAPHVVLVLLSASCRHVAVGEARINAEPTATRPEPQSVAEERDSDGDGAVDTVDMCPLEAEDCDGDADDDGCPDLDDDGDGVVDGCDMCPDEAGSGADGCVPRVSARCELLTPEVFLQFATASAVLPRGGDIVVAAVADVLVANPSVRRVEVRGHAHPEERQPTRVAARRAELVVRALVRRGVDGSRLVARAVISETLDSTHTSAEDRAREQRVDFVVIDPAPPMPGASGAMSPGVANGCPRTPPTPMLGRCSARPQP